MPVFFIGIPILKIYPGASPGILGRGTTPGESLDSGLIRRQGSDLRPHRGQQSTCWSQKKCRFLLWSDVSPENAGAFFVGETFAREVDSGGVFTVVFLGLRLWLPSRIDAFLLGVHFFRCFKAKRLTLPKVLIEKTCCLFVCLLWLVGWLVVVVVVRISMRYTWIPGLWDAHPSWGLNIGESYSIQIPENSTSDSTKEACWLHCPYDMCHIIGGGF